ncbi:MAG: class F sortase, partial [Anaerolineaceae bacterium]|nr:class F sortase [Anaerolineaceae bacterium]
VLNLTANDFVITGGTTAAISQITSLADVSYSLTVSGGDLASFNGAVGLDLASGQDITDLAGNALTQAEPIVDQTYELDNSIPTVVYGIATVPADGSTLYEDVIQLAVQFSKAVVSGGGSDAADNVDNFMLVSAGVNQMLETVSCDAGPGGDDELVTIDQVVYDAFSFISTLDVNGGTALPVDQYELFICGSTSIYDLSGNVLNGGSDSTLSFRIAIQETSTPETIPSTGFPMGQITALTKPDAVYAPSGMSLAIPRLGVNAAIQGVPRSGDSWSVSWLGDSVGWLQGSAFPTWQGNSVITGHIWNANNTAGPFRYIGSLKWGDRVEVQAWGETYIYEVRSVELVAQQDISRMMQHEDNAWLTLVTCTGYDPVSGEYQYRLLVRAVLIAVE